MKTRALLQGLSRVNDHPDMLVLGAQQFEQPCAAEIREQQIDNGHPDLLASHVLEGFRCRGAADRLEAFGGQQLEQKSPLCVVIFDHEDSGQSRSLFEDTHRVAPGL